MDIDIKDVSIMDCSTWHNSVNETEALTRNHMPNQHVAEWILRLRNGFEVSTPPDEDEAKLNTDIFKCNQLLQILACDYLRRHQVLTFDSNVQKVIDEYERRINVQ